MLVKKRDCAMGPPWGSHARPQTAPGGGWKERTAQPGPLVWVQESTTETRPDRGRQEAKVSGDAEGASGLEKKRGTARGCRGQTKAETCL